MGRELKVKSVRALERGLLVLETIQKLGTCRLAELHNQTNLSRATLLRSLRTLEEQNWVSWSEDLGYRVGSKLAPLGAKDRGRQIAELSGPMLERLGKDVAWPTDVAVRRGTSMIIVRSSRRQAPFPIKRDAEGRRLCLMHSALGRAYISFCPALERQTLLQALRASPNPDDRPALAVRWVERMITESRDKGYGVREAGYYAGFDDEGAELSAIAVPVLHGELVIACINLMWIAGTQTVADFARQHLPLLKVAAASLAIHFEATT
jgi:IclR family mhp operon transcriptional activator